MDGKWGVYGSTDRTMYWDGTYFPAEGELGSCTTGHPDNLPFDLSQAAIEKFVGQWERGGQGDKQGRLHLQFRVKFAAIHREKSARWILRTRNGQPFTHELAGAQKTGGWDYCRKELTCACLEHRFEKGEIPNHQNGKRADINFLHEACKSGKYTAQEIGDKFPTDYQRYATAIHRWCQKHGPRRRITDGPRKCVEIRWGKPGCGKSYDLDRMVDENPEEYYKKTPGKWWDGYNRQHTVIFNEFSWGAKDEITLQDLKQVCDRGHYAGQVKNGFINILATKFIFISNTTPEDWWPDQPAQDLEAFKDRVASVKFYPLSFEAQKAYWAEGIEPLKAHGNPEEVGPFFYENPGYDLQTRSHHCL